MRDPLRRYQFGCALLLLLPLLAPPDLSAQSFDIVLARGRVMDPESGLDAMRYVGITGGKITRISTEPLQGRVVVDVSGLVVAPGFIDLHAHGQSGESHKYQAHDGVTTALELEVGVPAVGAWLRAKEGKA